MFRSGLLVALIALGLNGCLATQDKSGLARPDFSHPAPVSSTAVVRSGCHCGCGSQASSLNKTQDLTTPPEPQKGKKVIGELPEYQTEDQESF